MRSAVRFGWVGCVLAATACGGGGGGSAGVKAFVIPHVLEAHARVSQMAVGDVDGDGVPDLVLLDVSTASTTTLLSTRLRESPTLPSKGQTTVRGRFARGAGAYEPEDPVLVGDDATDVCVGDVDGDGVPDLVVACGASHQVRIWGGAMGGSGAARYHQWRWMTSVTLPDAAVRVAVGDVNGDGRCDLVTLDTSTGQAHVLFQTSPSPLTFAPGKDPGPVGACAGLVLVDLDRDGHLDLVTNRPDADAVDVLLGSATGAFTLRESPTKQSTGRAMAVGDVDGDGWCDVVVLAEGGSSVVCLHQLPSAPGTFEAVESPLGTAVSEDGAPVCVVTESSPGAPRAGIAIDEPGVHLQAGIAIGDPGVNGRRCVCSDGLALADVDRDGFLDLVMSPPSGDTDTSPIVAYCVRESPTRWSAGSRLVQRVRESPTLPSKGRMCAVCDLDQDGHLDVVEGAPDFDQVTLLYVDDPVPPPVPDYQERSRIEPTSPVTRCVVADVDRDGFPDLVCATNAGIEIRWRDAAGGLSAPTVLAAAQSFVDVAVGDVNGDGCPDLVVATATACATIPRDPANPRGFLGPITFPPSQGGNFRALALGDVDGDGFVDCVAIRESPSKASLGRGKAAGFFDVFTEIDCKVADPRGVAIADLDGDGHLDLVVCGLPECAVVLQDGSPGPLQWMPPETLPFMGGVRVAVGDVNGDGRADVVVSGDDGVEVALQSPFEGGVFQPAYALSTQACGGLALADCDRDGGLDCCFVEVKTGTLVVVHGDPDFDLLRVVSLNGLPPGEPVIGTLCVAGDVDHDGKADVVVCCPQVPGALPGTIRTFSNTR